MGVDREQMQLFLALLLVDGGKQHAAGVNAHHGARRKVRDGDAGFTHQLLRLIESVDAGEDGAVGARAVVQREPEKLFRFRHGDTFLDLDGTEIALREGVKIDKLREQRLDDDLGEIDRRDGGILPCGVSRGVVCLVLCRTLRLHGRDSDRTPELSGIIKHLQAFYNDKTTQIKPYRELSRISMRVYWCNFWCKV